VAHTLVWASQAQEPGTLTGTVIAFDQNEFATGGNAAALSMDNTGYAFVPAACAGRMSCGLILALHGCLQYHGQIGPAFVDDAGINQWADTNGIIVLYPPNHCDCRNQWRGMLGLVGLSQRPELRAEKRPADASALFDGGASRRTK